ncbi:hypothetical protein GXM_00728 [Nostoc sphaeroides CCNUC1]|uniref:Glycosyltransferase 2-like domain-containing protein n=2 Tax=Nostoc sphaeroides TaxID=446679 RepID=A0A5P8VS49_9NOSO|nr:hypothetical protein GXM_00728 [Nostoc sphaeroides CCNUC1]
MMQSNFISLENADLTIITLTYNSSKYIQKCISSIIKACNNLGGNKICHIVIDGKSQDNTVELIKDISPYSLIFYREAKGIYDALNYAVSLVKSPYLMYVHADDEIDKCFLVEMFQKLIHLNQNQNYILYGTVDFINGKSEILFSRKPPFFISHFNNKTSIIFHPNAIYSTALEKAYPYNIDKGLRADQDHIIGIVANAKLIRVVSANYQFRMSNASSTMKNLSACGGKKMSRLSLATIYVRLFETKLIKRFFMKLKGQSYWSIQ